MAKTKNLTSIILIVLILMLLFVYYNVDQQEKTRKRTHISQYTNVDKENFIKSSLIFIKNEYDYNPTEIKKFKKILNITFDMAKDLNINPYNLLIFYLTEGHVLKKYKDKGCINTEIYLRIKNIENKNISK